MTKNPYLARLLRESDATAELDAPPETLPAPDASAAPAAMVGGNEATLTDPKVQQLAKLWQSGDKMGVASSLLYAEATYKDFVNLVYIIGQEAGLELGGLLDELAAEEQLETPPQYSSLIKRASSGKEEDGVV